MSRTGMKAGELAKFLSSVPFDTPVEMRIFSEWSTERIRAAGPIWLWGVVHTDFHGEPEIQIQIMVGEATGMTPDGENLLARMFEVPES